MNRRNIFLLLVGTLLLLPVGAATGLDWGGSFTTNDSFQSVAENSDDDAFSGVQELVFYLTTPLSSKWEFVGQVGAFLDQEPTFAVDVEKLYFQRNRVFTPEQDHPRGLV